MAAEANTEVDSVRRNMRGAAAVPTAPGSVVTGLRGKAPRAMVPGIREDGHGSARDSDMREMEGDVRAGLLAGVGRGHERIRRRKRLP